MFIRELPTSNHTVRLIKPDVKRDAPLAVDWLAGPKGRYTLKMMGIPDAENKPTTLAEETQRIHDFLEKDNQYNWMVSIAGEVVGAVWVGLIPTPLLAAPSVSIMLGDPGARGHGVGMACILAVVGFLHHQGHREVYARHLLVNHASAEMFHHLGFRRAGQPYWDTHGLAWQNVAIRHT